MARQTPLKQVHSKMTIPLAVCRFAALNNFTGELALFVFLKSICQGALVIDNKVINAAAMALGCHRRTVKRRLEKLIDRNWLGRFKCGHYITRSFKELFRVECLALTKTGVEFQLSELMAMRAFTVSACIGYLAKQKAINKRRANRPGAKNAAPIPPGSALLYFHPLSCLYLSKVFNISISTASEWKQLGAEAGFLHIEKQFTRSDVVNRKEYSRQGFGDEHRLVFRNNRYFIQDSDLVAPKLRYKTIGTFTWKQKKSGQMPKHNKRSREDDFAQNTLGNFERKMAKYHSK